MKKEKQGTVSSVAPITNVGICQATINKITERDEHLPGMAVFYGPSGYGKTIAAAYCAHRERAYYIQCQSIWVKSSILDSILQEMGIPAAKRMLAKMEQIQEQLVLSGRLLIIDEMDHIVDKKAVEVVRDIYEIAQTPILLIGEEQLPRKLEKWERFHSRILEFAPAQPVCMKDANIVSRLYSPNVTVEPDLLKKVVELSRGSVRRVCVNVSRISKFGQQEGLESVDIEAWDDRPLYTSRAPVRNRAGI